MADLNRPNPDSGREPENPTQEKDKKVGFIDRLAQRSTGLPEFESPREARPAEKSAWRYAGIGLQFAATTGLFALMGYAVDRKMGWTPWAMVALTMLGIVGGLYLLIKEALRENRPPEKRDKG